MTDEKKIEQLLKAFYNGDTTPEEEAILLNFFNSGSLNEKWHTDRDIFNVLYDSSEITLPEGILKRLDSAVDKHITDTESQLNEIQNKNISFDAKRRKIFTAISSAAAIALLCMCLYFANDDKPQSQLLTDTYTNPEEAAIAAEQALMFVSNNLNKGLSSLEKVKEGVDKTNELLNENFKLN